MSDEPISLLAGDMLVYIGLGSNLGDGIRNCRRAIEAIKSDPRNRLVQGSPFYRTDPVGKKDQNWFINGVIAVETSMAPGEFMEFLLSVENEMGRIREERWGPRIIDLDILFYGDQVLSEGGLRIPHPRLHERRFVLAPLKDIAPDWVHPVFHKTVSQILAELEPGEKVFPVAGENA
jgi:2-amino-4-hydroxy-6-hydroxymethyldihydropteridine diphosphokinase